MRGLRVAFRVARRRSVLLLRRIFFHELKTFELNVEVVRIVDVSGSYHRSEVLLLTSALGPCSVTRG